MENIYTINRLLAMAAFGFDSKLFWILVIIGAVLLIIGFFGLDVPIGSFTFSDVGLILAFGSILTAVFNSIAKWSLELSIIIGIAIPVVVTLLLAFVLRPILIKSEHSTAYTEQDLIGDSAEVITDIPVGGVGEILIRTKANGNISRPARLDETVEQSKIDSPANVIITGIRAKSRIVYVKPFQPFLGNVPDEKTWKNKELKNE